MPAPQRLTRALVRAASESEPRGGGSGARAPLQQALRAGSFSHGVRTGLSLSRDPRVPWVFLLWCLWHVSQAGAGGRAHALHLMGETPGILSF